LKRTHRDDTQERAGSDVIELGVPFSDPLADGGTIQKANTDALNNGVTLKDCLNYVKDARSKGFHTPVVLMGCVVFDENFNHITLSCFNNVIQITEKSLNIAHSYHKKIT